MKKKIYLLAVILISIFDLNGQNGPVSVTGSYYQASFRSFITDAEQNYSVKFFFEEHIIDNIYFTADFKNTPLKDCLETILADKKVNFFISESNQVILYTGNLLSDLFPGTEVEKQSVTGEITRKESASEKSISLIKLRQLQYQIINIGTPGNNNARTAILSGYVRNFETGEPIAGVNIYVDEKQNGVSTDAGGNYKIVLPLGNQFVYFTCIGMEPSKRNINLYSDGRLNVDMEVKVNLLKDAVIVGQGQNTVSQVHIGMEKINMITVKSIPALFGEADIIKSALTLPGVQTVGEGTSGFNVRGGNTDENLILIDQATIYYPSHFFGNFSAINSEIIDNATLYKGSFPVKYGGRISSIFEINTIEGNPDKISGSAGISPISARINVDGPFITKKSTFVTSFRSTYSNWLLDLMRVPELYNSKAGFYDAQAKLDLYINEKNSLLVNFYTSTDKFRLHSDTTYNYNNTIGSLLLRHRYNKRLNSNTSLIYSSFDYDISNLTSTDQSFRLKYKLTDISLNNDFEYSANERMKYSFGADLNFYSINPGERTALENSNITPLSFSNDRAIEYGLYGGAEYKVSEKLKVEGGVRLSGLLSFGNGKKYIYSPGLPYSTDNIKDTVFTGKYGIQKTYMNPEWRLSLNYSTGMYSSIKFSYNKTAQYIHMLSNTVAISPTDTWKLSDEYLRPELGNQFSTGYFMSFNKKKIEVSAEVYYKMVNNIKEYKAGANLLLNDHIETEIVNAQGRSYGLELSIEKSGGRLFGRIDYTYSRTLIRSVSPFREEMINNGEYFPANYDKPQNLSVLTNVKVSRRLLISAGLNYSTGRPITYPVTKYQLGDEIFLQYSKYNQYRIPDYFRADLSVTVNSNLKKQRLTNSSITFSLYNLTARKNAYSIYFISEGGKFDAYQLSIFGTIIPTITYNIKF